MSDPAKSPAEIEDVLSSIRRLVSEHGTDHTGRLDPVDLPPDMSTPRPVDRLVLTPALRVSDPDDPWVPVAATADKDTQGDEPAHAPDVVFPPEDRLADWAGADAAGPAPDTGTSGAETPEPAEAGQPAAQDDAPKTAVAPPSDWFEPEAGDEVLPELEATSPVRHLAAVRAVSAAAEGAGQGGETPGHARATGAEASCPEPATPVAALSDDADPDDPGDVGALGAAAPTSDTIEHAADADDLMPAQTVNHEASMQSDELDPRADGDADDPLPDPQATETEVAAAQAIGAAADQSDAPSVDDMSTATETGSPIFSRRAFGAPRHDAAPSDATTDPDQADEIPDQMAADEIEDLGDDPTPFTFPDDDDDDFLDEDTLRELIVDIVREELQGALGQRITRNVRKMVRREIRIALAAEELD